MIIDQPPINKDDKDDKDDKDNKDNKDMKDIKDNLSNININILDFFKIKPDYINSDNIKSEKQINKLIIKEYDLSKEYIEIEKDIKTLDDLIKLIDLYDVNDIESMEKYTLNLKKLYNMKDALIELQNLVGMNNIKKLIVKQIIYFLQDIEEHNDMMHTIITGAPGIGKTSLGIILAKIYYSMGLIEDKESFNPLTGKLEKFTFKIYKRSDLIGQYLGHTAIKTQKAINECLGGIMFLDEAYSLGHEEKNDIYSKECLDTINQNLSENKKKFILIIAGYPEELDKCFFSQNEGLKRRFAFKYNLEKYTSLELAQILKLKIKSNNWLIDDKITLKDIADLINNNKEMFENFGGDIESWLLHIKINHGSRIFGKHPKHRRILNITDLIDGLKLFKESKNNNKKDDIFKNLYF